ncbi:DHH family phosphoesterase [Fervidibacillus halotolerans]|uniref:Bifunctional oligoribonuclease/PAP phosphatase NrnA n=1 Tax=Fervidibacillus halotolerans TaxID=2980027 RepID=A0A9E8RXZ2_9BACI|nr:bifunctional oligoribonuclease/PAP phosphatase NrnA [Fervidibacillus halotolerans]WAA11673.1 bifunctional oligoribonuclease/PAP phosphatase NrnA [Fervidibacillus halotolerans]
MKEKIYEKIIQYDTIIIHRHVRPDPDAYGSQGGLAEIIKHSFPDKNVYIVGENEKTLMYLNQMDEVSDTIFQHALVIVCDTANRERICDDRYQLGNYLIKIDHHPNEDPYGDLNWVDTSASSTSEMIYEWFLHVKDKGLKMNAKAARLLYAGIVGDTGRFLYPSTTAKTFRYASELIEYPFSRTKLHNQMYEMTENLVKFEGYILQHFEKDADGIGKVVITKEQMASYQLQPSEVSLLVSVLGKIKGIVAWVFFIEEDDQIRVRLRSKGPIVNEVAKKYNGGGHPLAAGATIYRWEEIGSVMDDLREAVKTYKIKG